MTANKYKIYIPFTTELLESKKRHANKYNDNVRPFAISFIFVHKTEYPILSTFSFICVRNTKRSNIIFSFPLNLICLFLFLSSGGKETSENVLTWKSKFCLHEISGHNYKMRKSRFIPLQKKIRGIYLLLYAELYKIKSKTQN